MHLIIKYITIKLVIKTECDTLFKCIQKENYKPLFNRFRKNALENVEEVTTGKPLKNLTKEECYQWADMKGLDNRENISIQMKFLDVFYTQIMMYITMKLVIRTKNVQLLLNVYKKPKKYSKSEFNSQKDVLESEIQKNLLSNVVIVTDGNNIKTVSEQQCKAYAKSLGTTMGKGNDTSGCYLAPHKGGGYGVYFNKKTGKGKCYYNNDSDYRKCIQNNLNRNNTYSKQSCKGDVGGEYDCRVDGTWDQITVKGWDRNKYGQKLDDAKHFCNTHKDCVAVASSSANWNWPVHTTSKFKPCNEGDNCNPKMNYHTKQKCKKPIDGVWSKEIGESCEWECPGRSDIQKKTVPKFRVGGGYACPTQNFTYNKDNKLFEGDHSDARNLHPYSTNYGCKRPSGANFGNPYTIQDKRINFKSSCSDWDKYL